MALVQNKSRSKPNLKLLEACQKLERAEAKENCLRAKEICELTEFSDVSVSNEVLKGLETSGQIKKTRADFVNRHIISYMIPPIQNFDQNNIQENLLPSLMTNVQKIPFIRSSNPFPKTHNCHTYDKKQFLKHCVNRSLYMKANQSPILN